MAPRDVPSDVFSFNVVPPPCALKWGIFSIYLFMFLSKARQGLNVLFLALLSWQRTRPPFLDARHGCIFFFIYFFWARSEDGLARPVCGTKRRLELLGMISGLRRLHTMHHCVVVSVQISSIFTPAGFISWLYFQSAHCCTVNWWVAEMGTYEHRVAYVLGICSQLCSTVRTVHVLIIVLIQQVYINSTAKVFTFMTPIYLAQLGLRKCVLPVPVACLIQYPHKHRRHTLWVHSESFGEKKAQWKKSCVVKLDAKWSVTTSRIKRGFAKALQSTHCSTAQCRSTV